MFERRCPETAQQRERGHLNQTMLLHPLGQLIGIPHQEVVPLRMSEHRDNAAVQELREKRRLFPPEY